MEHLVPPITEQLWQVACWHKVIREELRSVLGQPHHVEVRSASTYGGEEDWWRFRLKSGQLAVVCLRVPYEDAVILTDLPEQKLAAIDGVALPFTKESLEIYEQAYSV